MRRQSSSASNIRAERLRKCYQFERTFHAQRFGKPAYRVPSCWSNSRPGSAESGGASIWDKLLRLAQSRDVDPIRYIQWCLSVLQIGTGPAPEPNQLLQTARIKAFVETLPDLRRQIGLAFKIQKREAESYFACYCDDMTAEDAWVHVLCDDMLSLSPLFRWGVARIIAGSRGRRLMQLWEDDALFQYHRNPDAYDELWRATSPELLEADTKILPKWTPPDFRERAERLYDEILDRQP